MNEELSNLFLAFDFKGNKIQQPEHLFYWVEIQIKVLLLNSTPPIVKSEGFSTCEYA